MLLPFDSHNHVHLGPSLPLEALLVTPSDTAAVLSGMAIMSTHPRDFDRVFELSQELPIARPGVKIVPAFGVHPWFLHELTEQSWETSGDLPCWILDMEERLVATPNSIVGEIGLDGFHFDPETRELVSPLEKQAVAFRLQMELAGRLERNVSVHTVQCMGLLMDTLAQLRKNGKKLPPKIYFHAFGGKMGTVDQLLALCGRAIGNVYFGFAPIVNFRAPKTAELVRKIGIERLLLETDHEDAALVPQSMKEGIRFMADALECSTEQLVERTTMNAYDFYQLE
jgi:Tat protein secretion system quality control protein TatD with DNase activity